MLLKNFFFGNSVLGKILFLCEMPLQLCMKTSKRFTVSATNIQTKETNVNNKQIRLKSEH